MSDEDSGPEMSEDKLLAKLDAYKNRRENAFAKLTATLDMAKKNGITSVTTFLARCSELDKLKDSFDGYQDAIIEINSNLSDAKKRLSVNASTLAFDEAYYEIRAMESTLRNKMDPPSHAGPEVKLPRIQVPEWDGNLSECLNFFALYNQVVHDGPYSPSTKFTYLKSFLKGPPLKFIENLAISDSNYAIAYSVLRKHYISSRSLASFYLDKMFEFKRITSESSSELQEFISVFDTTYKGYSNVEIEDHYDYMMFHFAVRLLPQSIRLLFERSLDEEEDKIPKFDELIRFVKKQCKINSLSSDSSPSPRKPSSASKGSKKSKPSNSTTLITTPSANSSSPPDKPSKSSTPPSTPTVKCFCCSEAHPIYGCTKFLALPSDERFKIVSEKHRCFRCLGSHPRSACTSKGKCGTCSSHGHHSYIHEASVALLASNQSAAEPTPGTSNSFSSPGESALKTTLFTNTSVPVHSQQVVLLGTAQGLVRDRQGRWSPVRIVIDTASQTHLITSDAVKRLGLSVIPKQVQLCGASNQALCTSLGVVDCVLTSRKANSPHWCVQANVINKICSDLPTSPLPFEVYNRFCGLDLADRSFHRPNKIDFLLGAALYPEIFPPGAKIIQGSPAVLETFFGMIIMGTVALSSPEVDTRITMFTSEESLSDAVQQFWKTEEVESVEHVDPSHALVESHFMETHYRNQDGSFVVRLPFKDPSKFPPFGNSRAVAERRWYNVERKLRKDEKLREAYHSFMREYRQLGHMKLSSEPGRYIIPHFAVLRPESATSPLRVVFDGSCKDTSGISLNDRLEAGPPLHKDICEVITFFRLKSVAITCDVKMAFRCIWVHPDDQKFQHILWRESERDPLLEYTLLTVTYGLAPSPFLCKKSLAELAKAGCHQFPAAAQAITDACYMDDICYSAENVDKAKQLKDELIALLRSGGFQLRKWACNVPSVLDDIPPEHKLSLLALHPDEKKALHVLGVVWDPATDSFTYKISVSQDATTKRAILSQVASIFDPLGWLSPVVFWAKSYLQELWAHGLDWDTPLNETFSSRWAAFAGQLDALQDVRIPRHCLLPSCDSVQLVGMSDASQLGYSAVTYLRCVSGDEISTHLLKAKTKVAPLKTQTVPRLELSGTLLLAKLVNSHRFLIDKLNIQDIYLFCDSQVVLAWLKTPPHQLKTFVANRVVTILEYTKVSQWRHISTSLNSADSASRGLSPNQLLEDPLWWQGPPFLRLPVDEWPESRSVLPPPQALVELKKEARNPEALTMATTKKNPPSKTSTIILDLINKYSSLLRLRRVVCWVLRFTKNSKSPTVARVTSTLRVNELATALNLCVRVTQQQYFARDIKALKKGHAVSKELRSLSPYFSKKDDLLRVGGRLNHAALAETSKHPILLPKKAPLSRLICDYYHLALLHAGSQATQAMIQKNYWIISLRSLLRQRIRACAVCSKDNAKQSHPIMADLPPSRVTPNRAFLHSGVDMAGPLLIKSHSRRNAPHVKAYICIFVCMSTKAVHIELTSDLSTATYLAALDRFIARRGLCQKIFCDQGRNFVGASREMREICAFLRQSEPSVADCLSSREIEYVFNPPESPWMGGLWEAAVKSAKRHLYRIHKNHACTYEEMSTLLARIEAVLNSRPLCPAQVDPNQNFDYLSPGHFLIGAPLTSPPEYSWSDVPTSHLSRWQTMQQMSQEFWNRWSKEYLNTLIQRKKWNVHQRTLNVGEPVFIFNHHTKPLDWPLGRVIRLVPSSDGIPRAAEVKTSHGTFTRPVASLVPLPQSE